VTARSAIVLAGLTGLALWATGCGGTPACGPSHGVVQQVIDGDTIVMADGTKIRYLLINAQEITKGHNDCYGQEARAYNVDLVQGKDVQLTYDPKQCKDRFGRTLAYIGVGGQSVNALEVQRGYACVDYIPPAGADKVASYQTMQSTAQQQQRGMWGACTVGPCFQ